MIASLKHRGLKRLYERGNRSGIRPDLLDTVEDILARLDQAETPQAMDFPRLSTASLDGRAERLLVRHRSGELAYYLSL
jgi:proteic killer suppression protein